MYDLLFKNIPAEGFDPDCGFSDRISNPAPAKTPVEPDPRRVSEERTTNSLVRSKNIPAYSNDADRLSNGAPARRRDDAPPVMPANINAPRSAGGYDDASRLSSPTLTRRSDDSRPSYPEPRRDVPYDSDSRVSSPTLTRRRNGSGSEPPVTFSSLGPAGPDEMNRASSPTLRRRTSSSPVNAPDRGGMYAPPSSPQPPQASDDRLSSPSMARRSGGYPAPYPGGAPSRNDNLSFAGTGNPYGTNPANRIDNNRASEPALNRRSVPPSDYPSRDEGPAGDYDRMSNCLPSSRK